MAVDVLKYISKSDIERMRYEDEILAEIDHEEDIETAVRANNIEKAKELIKLGTPIENVLKVFDLVAEDLEDDV